MAALGVLGLAGCAPPGPVNRLDASLWHPPPEPPPTPIFDPPPLDPPAVAPPPSDAAPPPASSDAALAPGSADRNLVYTVVFRPADAERALLLDWTIDPGESPGAGGASEGGGEGGGQGGGGGGEGRHRVRLQAVTVGE